MEYKKLLSVTGLPGLFELMASKGDGAIVRSLTDQQTRFVSSRSHQFSQLESIEVYTVSDNVNLAEVFKAMKASETERPDPKNAAALRKYFETVYPAMDQERVYVSDMKKMVLWLAQLEQHEVALPEPAEEAEDAAE